MIDSADARRCVAENVRFCMESQARSMADLGDAVGTTATTIHRIVHAASDPAFTLVARIADYFGVTTDDLMQSPRDFKRIYSRRQQAREPVPA